MGYGAKGIMMTESNPTVGDQQSVEQKLAPLLDLLKAADGQTKAAIRNAISASGVVERAKPKTTNADARRIAYSAGEIIQPPGFVPQPSDALVDMLGKEQAQAVQAERHHKAENGNGATTTGTAREAEQLYGPGMGTADDLATIAQEEFSTDVAPLPSEFTGDGPIATE
tara:strand:+ start:5475 stop:5981 length:507 start_codon:yes stop_codon:yes gene_type:complete